MVGYGCVQLWLCSVVSTRVAWWVFLGVARLLIKPRRAIASFRSHCAFIRTSLFNLQSRGVPESHLCHDLHFQSILLFLPDWK